MKQHYYIHIGNGKTGTTSIQAFLNKNRNALKKKDVYYPQCRKNLNHHHLIRDKKNERLSSEGQRKEWTKTINEASKSRCSKVVISSERLASLATQHDIEQIRNLLTGHTVTIIFYVRRHDTYMQSVYVQDLKTGGSLLTPEEYIHKNNRNYLEIANRWANVFGDKNFIVFPFESQNLKPSLVHTFLNCIGEEMHGIYALPQYKNESPHSDVIASMVAVTRVAQKGLFSEEDLKYVNCSLRGAPCQHIHPSKKQSIFSPAQQLALINGNDATYKEMARRFLDQEDGVLFKSPLPDENTPWLEHLALTPEILLMLMTSLHVETHRRMNRLQRKLPQNALRSILKKIKKLILKAR